MLCLSLFFFILYEIQNSKEAFPVMHIPHYMPFFHVSQKNMRAIGFLMNIDLPGYVSWASEATHEAKYVVPWQ